MLNGSERVIVALDLSPEDSIELAKKLQGHATWMKVGMTLFYAAGPSIVKTMHDLGYKVFLDLKLHDIPHQVRGAARAASLAGADILSIHGLGSPEMIKAAREGVEEAATLRDERTKLVAITVLTSMDKAALESIGISDDIEVEVERLETMAIASGADGVVCSPLEAADVRQREGSEVLVVTPGVRPQGSVVGDQSRVMTPSQAIAQGSSHIVVGRPITQAKDPVKAFDCIVKEVESAVK